MRKGREIAIWFMQNGFNATPDVNGNMKLNKLLSFAQLISLTLYNEPLFTDDMYAFKNGLVIEDVRKEYRTNLGGLITDSHNQLYITSREQEILEYTNELFGGVDADELSLISHQYRMWKEHFSNSTLCSGYDTEKQRIRVTEILESYKDDLEKMRIMLDALDDKDQDEKFIAIRNTKFFYNPSETTISKEIIDKLHMFPAIDKAYSFYIDSSQGLVIY